MKKILVLAAATTVILAAVSSCNKVEGDFAYPESLEKAMSFEARIANTKTSIDGVKTYWKAGDSIAVFNHVTTAKFTTESAGATAVFSGVLGDATEYAAVYPYVSDALFHAANVIKGSFIPQSQKGDGSDALLGTCFSSDSTLTFQPLSAVIRFEIAAADDKFYKKVEFKGNNGETYFWGHTCINLTNGNTAPDNSNASSVYVENEEGLAAGAYYLCVYCGSGLSNKTLSKGVTFTFTAKTNGSTTALANSSSTVIKKGSINNFGVLTPERPILVKAYDYPETKTVTPFTNMFLYSGSSYTNASKEGNVITFTESERSVAEAKITFSDGLTVNAISGGAGATGFGNCNYNNYITAKNWTDGASIIFSSPVKSALSGPIAFSFNVSCGTANTFKQAFNVQWSTDGENWTNVDKVYSIWNNTDALAAGNSFSFGTALTSFLDTPATAVFTPSTTIPDGSTIYVKIINHSTVASTTLRINQGSVLYSFVPDTDFSADPDVILSENFASARAFTCDVTGTYNGVFHCLNNPSRYGIDSPWTGGGIVEKKLGHVLLGYKLGASADADNQGAIITPALSNLSAPTDVILSFKASLVNHLGAWNVPDVVVSITEGTGTVKSLNWTSPLADAKGEWTVGYCMIEGASATTKIKILSSGMGKFLAMDDIVIVPAE